MNIIEFAIKNVYRNIKAYFAYFISSTISAALLFSFTMIIFHPSFQVVQLPDYLNKTLNMTIVIAYLFLCFFVFYSVSVFLKSRYKEFGILYIMGASKKQIQKMICVENIIISSVSGVTGVIIGVVFSKILLAASGKLLGFQAMEFYFPIQSTIITLIAFVMIGIIISIFCSFIIKEDMILKLLKGTKKPKTEPKTSVFLAGICVILLTTGYYLAITAMEETIPNRIIPVTVMVIVATYLLFSELSVFIIRLIKNNRNFYMNRITVLWVSNLLYRIKDNTRIFFLITITSAIALTSIGGVYAYWRDKETQVNNMFPESFFLYDTYNNKNEVDSKIDFIEKSLKNSSMDYGKVSNEVKFTFPTDGSDELVLITEDTYKNLSKILYLDTISFNENETISIEYIGKDERNKDRENIKFNNLDLNVIKKNNRGILPKIFKEVYVVKDDVYEKINGNTSYFGAFNVKNYKETLDICKNYSNEFISEEGNKYSNNFLKAQMLESVKIGYGVLLFSTIFIGLIFFITTGSFLYNKCYMDIIEDKKKYKQLNKIGLTFREIKGILNIEIGVLFLLPYIVAVVHFFFAISALKYAFGIPITTVVFQVIGIMLLVQIVYFLIIRKNYLLEVKKELIFNK